jgi:hypothetical protein
MLFSDGVRLTHASPHISNGNSFTQIKLRLVAISFRVRPMHRFIGFVAILLSASCAFAQASSALWRDLDPKQIRTSGVRDIVPARERVMALDKVGIEALVLEAPNEKHVSVHDSSFELDLPLPEGGFARFRVVETAVMAPELAAKYPSIKTYLGQRIDEPSTTVRFDLTNRGLRAQFIANTHTSYIEPFQKGDVQHYSVFNKRDYPLDREPMRCSVTGAEFKSKPNLLSKNDVTMLASGANLRTYRLAVATTGEYTTALGGTKLDGLSGIVTTMNRVNGIYEREIAVRMQLVANNDLLVYTNASSDPYTNDDGELMLDENQSNLNQVIGNANYDIGHVFSTGGGGIASLGSVCVAARKAQGVTGQSLPRGDGFDVDFVAHEMGHQFDGDHTFNGSTGNCGGGNRSSVDAFEPGSGSTIQAYAGICGATNIQPFSDPYFHRRSLDQLIAFTTSGAGGSCGVQTSTGNTPPTVTVPLNFNVPTSTPFQLTATASDVNGDSLTYTWEQMDLGAANASATLGNGGAGPTFRSFAPSTSPTRTFPSLRYILNNANVVPSLAPLEGTTSTNYFTGERLSDVARTLNFRVTVRDNRVGGGGTNEAATTVNVISTPEPFAVTAPNTTGISWASDSSQTITWKVANTNGAPFNTANVRIALSVDGGYTFAYVLTNSAPNNGSFSFTVPASIPGTTRARIRVSATNSIFFDINDVDFTVVNTNTAPSMSVTASLNVSQGGPSGSAVVATVSDAQQAAGSVSVSLSGVPPDLSASVANVSGNITLTATALCSLYAPTSGTQTYPLLLTATDSSGAQTSQTVNVLASGNSMPSLGTYANQILIRGNSTTVVPTAAPADANGNFVGMSVTPTNLPGSAASSLLAVAANGNVTVNTDATTTIGTHLVRAIAQDSCGAVRIREFQVTVQPVGAYLIYTNSAIPTGNGVIEFNECNSLSVSLQNIGNATATVGSATLWSASPGILVSQPTLALPNIAATQTQSTTSPFQISTSNSFVCGANAEFTLVANYAGGASPQALTFSVPTGTTSTVSTQAFDGVVAPALPSGWTTARTGTAPPAFWATSTSSPDSAPNVAFTNGVASVASNSLISPAIALPAANTGATVSIRHAWNFEGGFDGGVLELSTDGGTTFNDVTAPAVGGVFSGNGYNVSISTQFESPIAGRSAWSASQPTYVTSVLQLPATLNGQTIRLRFRGNWDNDVVVAGANWRVDGVGVTSGRTCLSGGGGACVAPALLNIDDSSAPDVYNSATDGVLLLRYLFGMRNEALQNARGTNPQRDAAQIATFVNTNISRYDVDGDGEVRATTDGLMILRRLLGLSGAALTANARIGVRTDNEISNAIDALRP